MAEGVKHWTRTWTV